jgi:PAS domain S-box-containing protein
MKIRAKLLLFLFPPLLLSGLIINYLTGRAVCATLHNETARRTIAGTNKLLETASPDFAHPRENKLLPFLYTLATGLNASGACFADTGGTILAHTDVVKKGRRLPAADAVKFLSAKGGYEISSHRARGLMTVYIPVNENRSESPEELALLGTGAAPRHLGALVITLPLQAVIATENDMSRKTAIILAAVFSAILLAAFFLTGLALRPIDLLTQGTERIRRGDYEALIPVTSRDEFGNLARSFNDMSKTLSGTIVSKNYLDGIVDNMLDMLIVTDMKGVIKKANRAAQAALGAAENEILGLTLLKFMPEENQDPRYWLERMNKTGKIQDYETALATGSGSRLPVIVSTSFIKDNDGKNSAMVALFHDITARKAHAIALPLVLAKNGGLAAPMTVSEIQALRQHWLAHLDEAVGARWAAGRIWRRLIKGR